MTNTKHETSKELKNSNCSILMEEVKEKVRKLKEYGMSESEIVSQLNSSQPTLSKLVVSKNYRIYAACAEAGDVEPFTAEVRIDIGEDGSFSFDGDPVNDVVGDIGNPEYAFADEFYDQALDELLASGEITEEEYEELLEVDVDELVTIF